MNNIIKNKNLEEVINQIKRSEVKKCTLIENIYKEYENYFQIVRKSILTAVDKAIFGLYSELSINDKTLNITELNNCLSKNVSLLIHSKLPLITVEQLKLGDFIYSKKKLMNIKALEELIEFKEYQTINLDYEHEQITKESFEFNCNSNSSTYKYYEFPSEDELSSVNFDEKGYFNSLPKQKFIKKIDSENKCADSLLELIDETNNNENDKLNNFNNQSHNLELFDVIDQSLNNILLDLSYEINSELFKIKLIKKLINEDTFKCLSNNDYIIKHPYPFVIGYDLTLKSLSSKNSRSSDIFFLNITNVELEFYNLDLSIKRNNINELKHKLKVLNKKQKYWMSKELTLNNLN